MAHAVVVDAVRSPIGRGRSGGRLSQVHPVELLAQVLKGVFERNDLDPGTVDDVLIGCVSQGGEQSATPGRLAWLAAGLPEHVPAATIDRRCGSSQQALAFAVQGIQAGAYDIAIAGGVESMSRVPMGSARGDADVYGPLVTERYAPGLISQGVSAELVAARFGLSREAMDEYSMRSHVLAGHARTAGHYEHEIISISTPDQGSVDRDETIRPDTTMEALSLLPPAFADEAMSERFPEISWSVTAGNSSQISDGASAVLVMSEERAGALGLTPLARFVSFSVSAADPILMLTAPMPATVKVLARAGLTLDDIGHYEVNEAFASVTLAWQKEFGTDPLRLNPIGGAIALGHPLGASGTRVFTTMLHHMRRAGTRYGLQTMCEAGGMANALIVEAL